MRLTVLARRAATHHGRTPRCVPVPLGLVKIVAAFLEAVSKDPPITRAMLGVLDHDDEVDVSGLVAETGLELTALDDMLKRCIG